MCMLTKNHEDGDSDKGNYTVFSLCYSLGDKRVFFCPSNDPGSKEVSDFFLCSIKDFRCHQQASATGWDSMRTSAVLVMRLTEALVTPGVAWSLASMAVLQDEQVIPPSCKRTVDALPLPSTFVSNPKASTACTKSSCHEVM